MRGTERTNYRTTHWAPFPSCGREAQIRATYGFHYIPGNRAPHFSVTADVRERPQQRRDDWSGGAMLEEIAEHFPELRRAVRWHLVDQDGHSTHYAENAAFWWDIHKGRRARAEYDRDPLGNFKSTVVFGAVEGDSLEDVERVGVAHWCWERRAKLAAAMWEDLRALCVEPLEGFPTEPIETDPPPPPESEADRGARHAREQAAANDERARRIEERRAREHESADRQADSELWAIREGFDSGNLIYYPHTGRFCFGWQRRVSREESERFRSAGFPWDCDIKHDDGTTA